MWGATFTVIQDAVERVPPLLFIALRFGLATLAMAAVGAFRGMTRAEARAGATIGLALFAGYGLQTVGLQYTSATNAAFLTGLFVIFTPLLGAIAYRTLPSRAAGGGALLAGAGLVLLTAPSGIGIGRGDTLEVLTGVSFAVHILLIARLAPGRNAARLAAMQFATTAVLAGVWSAAAERTAPLSPDGETWAVIVFTALFATAAAFWIQTRAQQALPPVRTAVILTAEPVFAGIVGVLFAGDVLGARGWAGAGLILGGIVVAELLAPERERL